MRSLRALVCLLLCAALALPLAACGGGSGGYRIIDEYSGVSSYYIAFRKGDRLKDYVTAALEELAAGNSLSQASNYWFGEDIITVRGDDNALEELEGDVPQRTVTVGVDISNMPMSYQSAAGYEGFDIDLMSRVCSFLGWSMVVYPIAIADAAIELNAGNIDIAMAVPDSGVTSDVDVSPAYLTNQYVLVTRSGSHIRRRSGLKGKSLGVVVSDESVLYQDSKNRKFIDSLGAVIYQTNTEGLFQALMKGEVDGVLVSSVVAAYYMR